VFEAERMPEGTKKAHIHNRARRYMEKRLLIDLWVQWGRCGHRDGGTRQSRAALPPVRVGAEG